MSRENIQNSSEKENNTRKYQHEVNNHLSVIGVFLTYVQGVSNDELFKELLKNADKSFREILKILRGM